MMKLDELTKSLLYNSVHDVWFAVSEEKGWNWYDIATLKKFVQYLKENRFQVRMLPVCPAGAGEKAEFAKTVPTSLVPVSIEPRVMRVLPRGNWMSDDGEIVTPAVPHFLAYSEAKPERLTRLDLARWLVSRDNPFTARVFINRLWKLVGLLRQQGIEVRMLVSERPGSVVYEDSLQVAAVP